MGKNMNKILEVNVEGAYCLVEPGEETRFFPIHVPGVYVEYCVANTKLHRCHIQGHVRLPRRAQSPRYTLA